MGDCRKLSQPSHITKEQMAGPCFAEQRGPWQRDNGRADPTQGAESEGWWGRSPFRHCQPTHHPLVPCAAFRLLHVPGRGQGPPSLKGSVLSQPESFNSQKLHCGKNQKGHKTFSFGTTSVVLVPPGWASLSVPTSLYLLCCLSFPSSLMVDSEHQ